MVLFIQARSFFIFVGIYIILSSHFIYRVLENVEKTVVATKTLNSIKPFRNFITNIYKSVIQWSGDYRHMQKPKK